MRELTLKDIHNFFKAVDQARLWGNDIEVCVSWKHVKGHMRWFKDKDEIKFEFVDAPKLTGEVWDNVNTLLAYLHHDLGVIDNYYKGYGNTAPGGLYRSVIEKLQKHLDEGLRQ